MSKRERLAFLRKVIVIHLILIALLFDGGGVLVVQVMLGGFVAFYVAMMVETWQQARAEEAPALREKDLEKMEKWS